MPASQKRSFSLPSEHAAFIDGLVAAGTYVSASEVIKAGLEALQERDAAIEQWLRNEVVPVLDAMADDPDRGIPAESVFAELKALHESRMKSPAA